VTPAIPADPWIGVELDPEQGGRRAVIGAWLRHLIDTRTPFADRRTWMLHGWLVSSMAKVKRPELMVDQIRLFMEDGGGSFPDLLRAITRDRAMLVYLDGRTSTALAPNENYGRELLELFSLGVGNYGEGDVQAAARALTGWVVGRDAGAARFVPFRHDDTPQTLLGVGGVHDVDSVVAAVTADPAHAEFVVRRVVREYLGDDTMLNEAVADLIETYVDGEMHLDPVIARALEFGLEGASTPIVLGPVPWFVISARATGYGLVGAGPRLARAATEGFAEMGQIPLVPPDVSGWRTGETWFTASSLIARTNVAAAIAAATPADEPIRIALDDGDLDRVAQQLGLIEPFCAATTKAVRSESNPTNQLTLALVSPENLLS
jgi:uncharacterized protein (DUF1800 family)